MHHVSRRVLSQITWVAPPVHLCTGENYHERNENSCTICGRKWNHSGFVFPPYRVDFLNRSKKWAIKARKLIVIKELNDNYDYGSLDEEPIEVKSNISRFDEGPVIEKYKTQIGVIHPIPTIQISRSSSGLFVLFFLMGMLCDKLLTSKKRYNWSGIWPRVPTSVSLLLEKDLQRKESVEWVNMILGKLWKVYRKGIENWIIGLLQPVIDNLEKPEYVQRVQIKQFSLGEEPLSVRNVERLTSRRANDLQYQIGLRYTGDARALLSLSLKFALLPIVVPVGIRDFDIDGELWVKLRLIESEPWVGGASWAFVSLPKIKFELSPFRLFNLMAIPVLSMFLTKLLTEDLPRLFVRPQKIVLDFQSGRTVGTPNGFRSVSIEEGNKDFVGELSVTLVDAQKLPYLFSGKTDPYVVLSVGDQVIRSKRNSQTTVIGPPGGPIWNQDFHMLVANPQKQKLVIHVKDSIGFADFTIGGGEVDLGSLKDTVPTDRVIILEGGWGFPRKRYSGQVSVRLTYKAYVEDEEDDWKKMESLDCDVSDDENLDFNEAENNQKHDQRHSYKTEKESLINIIQELLVSEEFKDILASEIRKTDILGSSKGLGQTLSSSRGRNKIFAALSSGNGSALVWLALMSSIATFISMKMVGTSFFSL